MGNMDRSPRVSIGLPAFKGRHLRSALLAWKQQTFPDFEVIVRDDYSPEDLRAIFETTVGGDPRFTYVRNERSTAPNFVDNWMKTLEAARGEFFVLGSDDDLYEPDYLQQMLALAARHPDIDIFDAHHDFIGAEGVVRTCAVGKEVESQIEWLYAVVCGKRLAVAQSVMCRTAALRAIGGFVNLPAAWGGCDWLTWAQLAKKGVANSSQLLMHWRTDGGNTTSAKDPYWTRLKLKAVRQARPLWRALAQSLLPADAEAVRQVAAIRQKVVKKFFRWMELCVVDELPPAERKAELRSAYRRGDLSLWRFLQARIR